MKLIVRIAKALLLARWKQTLVAAVGVTFSIAMFIALLSFMGGLNKLLDGLMLNRTPHIRLFNEIKASRNHPINNVDSFKASYNFIQSVKTTSVRQSIYNSTAIIDALKKDKNVIGAVPKITAPVFFNDAAKEITGVVNGIEIESEVKFFHLSEYIIKGNPYDLERQSNSIILGSGLAEVLLVEIGDAVQISAVSGERFPLKVVGIYQSGVAAFDKTQSYASIATVQKLMGKPNSFYTDIQIKLNDINTAPALAKQFSKIFNIDAEDAFVANAQLSTGSSVRNVISWAVGVVLLIVAGFGIYNILNMMIYEKMESIAILKATGFTGKDVKKIFLIIALGIGLFGGLLGLLFGLGISAAIDIVPFKTSALPSVETYPIDYNIRFYIIGIVFSFITTYFAGWLPSRKASKVDPVIIIRGK
jgi:lipoprotein-releasing system permease protein